MKKFLLVLFSISLSAQALIPMHNLPIYKDSLYSKTVDEKSSDIKEKILIAIQMEDYAYVERFLKSGTINPRMIVEGKPIIIHAAILDKAEMVLLLATYGAMLVNPVCEEGKDIMEYAKENNAIHAQAQIIIIQS
jgi:hypothetical protein